MGKASRDKGARRERQIVHAHLEIGLKAERVPLSGAARYQGGAHGVDVYTPGTDKPLRCEVKGRAKFPAWLQKWIGTNDAVFLVEDRSEPIVMLPWKAWARLIGTGGKDG